MEAFIRGGHIAPKGGAQSFQGEQSGDHSSLTEYKDCHLTANGGGGGWRR